MKLVGHFKRGLGGLALIAQLAWAAGVSACQCAPDADQHVTCCCGSHEAGACPMAKSGGDCGDGTSREQGDDAAPRTCGLAIMTVQPPAEAPSGSHRVVAPAPTVLVTLACLAIPPPSATASPPGAVDPRASNPILPRSTVLRL